MQMLSAGGIPCSGRRPAFESACVIDGYATKILDPQSPHSFPIPADARAIWLDRDLREQARSHMKFLGSIVGIPADRSVRRKFESSMRRDRPEAMAVIGRRPLLTLRFESLLFDPAAAAASIGEFVGVPFDQQAAARVVLPRSGECRPDMSIELMLANC